MATGKTTEIRKLCFSKKHEELLRTEVSSTLLDAFKERWGNADVNPQSPLVADVEKIELKFVRGRGDEVNKYSLHMLIPFIVDYHGIYAKRTLDVPFSLNADKPAEILAEEINGLKHRVLEMVKASVAELPDTYPGDCNYRAIPPYPFSSVSFLLCGRDYKRPGEISFQKLFSQIMKNKETLFPGPEDIARCQKEIAHKFVGGSQAGMHQRGQIQLFGKIS